MKITIIIMLTLIWVVYTVSACRKDESVILPYCLWLLLAAIWSSIL